MSILPSIGTFIDDLRAIQMTNGQRGISVVDLKRLISSLTSSKDNLSVIRKIKMVESAVINLKVDPSLAKSVLVPPRLSPNRDIYTALAVNFNEYRAEPSEETRKLFSLLVKFFNTLLSQDKIGLTRLARNELECRGMYGQLIQCVLVPESTSTGEGMTADQCFQVEEFLRAKEDSLVCASVRLSEREKFLIVPNLERSLELPYQIPAVVCDRDGKKKAKFPSGKLYIDDYSGSGDNNGDHGPVSIWNSLSATFPDLKRVPPASLGDEVYVYTGTFGMHRLFRNGYALVNLGGPRNKHLCRLQDLSKRIVNEYLMWPLDPQTVDIGEDVRFIKVVDLQLEGDYKPKYLNMVHFARVIVLNRRQEKVHVFLIDAGCYGTVNSGQLGSLPVSLGRAMRPLLSFVKIDGLDMGRDMDMVELCASLLVNLDGVEHDLGDDLDFWYAHMSTTSDHPMLRQLAAKVFRKASCRSQESPLSSSHDLAFHEHLCVLLCDKILRHDEVNEDAIFTLYYTMDRMPQDRLSSTYEDSIVASAISNAANHFPKNAKGELVNLIEKIKAFKQIKANGQIIWENSYLLFLKNRREVGFFQKGRCPPNRQDRRPPAAPTRQQERCPSNRNIQPIRGEIQRRENPPAITPRVEQDRKPGTHRTRPPAKYMSKLDIDRDIDYSVGILDSRFATQKRNSLDSKATLSFGTLIPKSNESHEYIFVEGFENRAVVQRDIVALLNADIKSGLVLLGITPEGLVKGQRLTRKGKDLFNQSWDDLLGGLVPDGNHTRRIKSPEFIKVLDHPKDVHSSPDENAYVIGIEVALSNNKCSGDKVWFKTANDLRAYLRLNGKTVEATPINIAKLEVEKGKKKR